MRLCPVLAQACKSIGSETSTSELLQAQRFCMRKRSASTLRQATPRSLCRTSSFMPDAADVKSSCPFKSPLIAPYAYVMAGLGSCSAWPSQREAIEAPTCSSVFIHFHLTLQVVSDNIVQMHLRSRSNPPTVKIFSLYSTSCLLLLHRIVYMLSSNPPFSN